MMLLATVFFAALILGPLYMPWPAANPYLVLVRLHNPWIYTALEYGYYAMWGSTFSLVFTVLLQGRERLRTRSLKKAEAQPGRLPALVPPDKREQLEVVLGRVYDPKRLGVPHARPQWAVVPEFGLYAGIMAIASIGWGKTRHTLTPIADQVIAFQCRDSEKKIGGLALEVKGTFCDTIRGLLVKYGREEDYIELSPGGKVKYNPIDRTMSPGSIASCVNTMMVNLYGEDRDKYWSQVGGEAIKNVVALFRLLQNGHCTLHDIMMALTDPDFLAEHLKLAETSGGGKDTLVVDLDVYIQRKDDLERQGFVIDQEHGELRAPFSKALHEWLKVKDIPYMVELDRGIKNTGLASIKRWYFNTWQKLRAETRTAVSSGLTPFLTLFDTDPELSESFCPAADDPNLFIGWEEAIESGKVVAVKFDTVSDSDMARLLGVLIKQAYQRAVLRRIPRMHREPRHYRQTFLIVDECHEQLTVGETGFGDDKFLAKSREARCIPVFATQSKTSMEASIRSKKGPDVIFGNLKTKIFGHLEDLDSAVYASKMCGEVERWIPHVSLGESGQKSRVSVLGKGVISDESSVNVSKGFNEQVRPHFRPDVFLNGLRNGQAIIRIFNGDRTETMVTYLTPEAVPFEVN